MRVILRIIGTAQQHPSKAVICRGRSRAILSIKTVPATGRILNCEKKDLARS